MGFDLVLFSIKRKQINSSFEIYNSLDYIRYIENKMLFEGIENVYVKITA
jgi:hypothetical protein